MSWIRLGAFLSFFAVLMGTFGAHGLPEYFKVHYENTEPYLLAGHPIPMAHHYLDVFHTGLKYHLYHGLAIILVGLLKAGKTNRLLDIAASTFFWGTVLFSGSLYILSVTGVKIWGMVAPMGGILYFVGWICLGIAGTCKQAASEKE